MNSRLSALIPRFRLPSTSRSTSTQRTAFPRSSRPAWLRRMLLAPAVFLAAALHGAACTILPIALPASLLSNTPPGTVISEIPHGHSRGCFTWLTWNGDPSAHALARRLRLDPATEDYTHPDCTSDHHLDRGDWVRTKPGLALASAVRGALDALCHREIILPVWDELRGHGEHTACRIAAFARVRLLNHRHGGHHFLRILFLGFAECEEPPRPPVVEAGPDQTLEREAPTTLTLSGRVTDPSAATTPTRLQWSQVAGPAPTVFSTPTEASTLATLPAEGDYTFRLTAANAAGASYDDIRVVVLDLNRAPIAVDASRVTPEDTALILELEASDPDHDALSWYVMEGPAHGELVGMPPSLVYLPAPDYSGSDLVSFRVSDGALESAIARVSIVVEPVNDPPRAEAGTYPTLAWPTCSLALSGSADDDSSTALAVRWDQVAGPGRVDMADPEQLATEATFSRPGLFTLRLTVSDGEFEATDTVDIVVNAAPEVSAGPSRLVAPGEWVAMEPVISDDGWPENRLVAAWTCPEGPAAPEFDDAASLHPNVRFPNAGTYRLRVEVGDGSLTSASETVWRVEPGRANQPPRVDAGPDRTLGWTSSYQLEGVVTDDALPAAGALRTAWSVVSSPAPVMFDAPGNTRTRATFMERGTYHLRLTAHDGEAEGSDDVVIRVYPDNLAPHVDAGPDLEWVMPDPVATTGAASPATASVSLLSEDHWDTAMGQPGLDDYLTENCLAGTGTNVFVAGRFSHAGGVEAVGSARWDGMRFHPLFDPRPLPLPNFGTHIKYATHECSISFCNDDLRVVGARGPEAFVGGYLKELAGISDGYWDMTARWTGDRWESWVFKQSGNHVRALLVTSNTVYAGGFFSCQPLDATPVEYPDIPWSYGVVAWDAVNGWSSLGRGIMDVRDTPGAAILGRSTYHAYVNALALGPDGSLYAAGQFVMDTPEGQANHIARWDGAAWHPLGTGLVGNGNNFVVHALAFAPDGSLYAGGNFTNAGGTAVRHVARWDGTSWHSLGNGTLNGASSTVRALAWNRSRLYVGGSFYEVAGTPAGGLACWDGSAWSTLGTPTQPGVNGSVQSLLAHHDGVFVGGIFTRVAGLPATNIALWRYAVPPVTTLTLHGSVTDDSRPAGTALSMRWEQVSGPGQATFEPPEAAITQARFTRPGDYTLRLVAQDGELAGEDIVRVTVLANQPPSVDAGPDLTCPLGEVIRLDGSVTDDALPANTALRARWTVLAAPGPVRFANAASPITTATFENQGIYRLRLSANDGQFTANDELLVVVGSGNRPPVVQVSPTPYYTFAGNRTPLTGWATDDGISHQTVRFIWRAEAGPGPVQFTDATAATTSATFWIPGVYTLSLSGTDGILSTAVTRQITVQPALDGSALTPPTGLGNAPTPQLPDAVTAWAERPCPLPASVSDDGLPANALACMWLARSGPGPVRFRDATAPGTEAVFPLPGTYTLQLLATDGAQSALAEMTVAVDWPPNSAPSVNAQAQDPITRPHRAQLIGTATDDGMPAGNALTTAWSKRAGPGEVTFYPSAADPAAQAAFASPGTYILEFVATDGAATSSTTVRIEVHDGTNAAPILTHVSDLMTVAGRTLPLPVKAQDDGLPAGQLRTGWSLQDGPGPAALAQINGEWLARFDSPGTYTLRFEANDDALHTAAAVLVTVLANSEAPVARLESLTDTALCTEPHAVTGTVSSTLLRDWILTCTPGTEDAPASTPLELARGNTVQSAAALGTLDPTLLPNGPCRITLRVTDRTGQVSEDSRTVLIDGQYKPGLFRIQFTDLSLPVAGIPLRIQRSYDSRLALRGTSSDFGPGWRLDNAGIRIASSSPLGQHWEQTRSGSQYTLVETRPHVVSITFPGDRVLHFRAIPIHQSQFGRPFEWTQLIFTNLPGTAGTLTIDGDNSAAVVGFTGPAEFIQFEHFEVFNPVLFRLVMPDGWTLQLDTRTGLSRAIDPEGRSLEFSASTLAHSAGARINIERNPDTQITAITDSSGRRTEYAYDSSGRLSAVRDPGGRTTRYEYDERNLLARILNPDGSTRWNSEFDAAGRLTAHTDGAGHTLRLDHDLAQRRTLVIDRLGHTTAHHYDARGNLLRTIDPLGFVTTRTYDAEDRLLTVTRWADALPDPTTSGPPATAACRTCTFVYDPNGNLTRFTDPLGRTSTFTYGPAGALQSFTGPGGSGITNTLDPHGHVLSTAEGSGLRDSHDYSAGLRSRTTSSLGLVTTFQYDALGRLIELTDPAGRRFDIERDSAGRLLAEILTAPGQPPQTVRRVAYDASGHLTQVVGPDGVGLAIQRDTQGRPRQIVDVLGRVQRFEYDAAGHVSRHIHADAAWEGYGYDAEERLIAVTNRLGEVTRIERDPRGLPLKIQRPGGVTESWNYDAFGQCVGHTDPRGYLTRYGYDAAGQLTSITNALGHVTRFAYDPEGLCREITDALGRVTTFAYNPQGLCTAIQYADGTRETCEFDPQHRPLRTVDAAGQTTAYAYSLEGDLVAVTNTLGSITRFAYDPCSRLAAITDALGHTTTFHYDTLGRLIRRSLPLGQTESYSYDDAGRLARHTDFNGHTTSLEYDALDRLVARLPDPRHNETPTRFEYDPLHRLITTSDPSGITRLAYDNAGHLATRSTTLPGVAEPVLLHYERDAAGQLTRTRSSTGLTDIRYAHDALGQLTTVHDAALGATHYSHNAAGLLEQISLPNGVTHTFSHDPAGRPTRILTQGPEGPLGELQYGRDPSGRCIAITSILLPDQQPATLASRFDYDAAGQLVAESHEEPQLSTRTLRAYDYDAVGNRLRATLRTGTAEPTERWWQFDANDRPLDLIHDANGNPLSGSMTDGGTYEDLFDSSNRLLQRTTLAAGQSVRLQYRHNAFGHLILKRRDQADGSHATFYLVDDQNPTGRPQVLEQHHLNPNGTLSPERAQCLGLTLVAERILTSQQPQTAFAGLDAQGSLRHQTDGSGQLVAFHDYDAWGNLTGGAVLNRATGEWKPQNLAAPAAWPHFGFTGAPWDPDLGAYHMGARDYDPALGRFRTTDPFTGLLHAPATLHRYLYTRNDPVNRIDPTGCFDIASVSLGIAVGRTLHDMYDSTAVAAGYGLMETLEGLAQGRSDEEILLRYEVGSMVGAGVGILIGKIAQIAGRALTGEIPLPSPANLSTAVRSYLDRQTQWARNILQGLQAGTTGRSAPINKDRLGEAAASPWLLDKRRAVVDHIDRFEQGGSFLVSEDVYRKFIEGRSMIGRRDGLFITTKSAMDRLLMESGGNVAAINARLGTFLSGQVRRVDVIAPLSHNARMPSGLEAGANNLFRWGGYTRGGMPEIVVDPVPGSAVLIGDPF